MLDHALKHVDLAKLAEAGERAMAKSAKIKNEPASRKLIEELLAAYDSLKESRDAECR